MEQIMNAVHEQLKNKCAKCMNNLFDYDMGLSIEESIKSMRRNKDTFPDWLTCSPIWEYRMYLRYCKSFNYDKDYIWIAYKDINEKILYDYSLTIKDIPMTNQQSNKHELETRQIMWREAQKEKLLLLYGKVPNDILNEILSFL